jgi:hypothetical protein
VESQAFLNVPLTQFTSFEKQKTKKKKRGFEAFQAWNISITTLSSLHLLFKLLLKSLLCI